MAKTKTKTKPALKPERKVSKASNVIPKEKEFRRNLDLDYSTARLVNQMKNSVSFYVMDNNSGNEVLVCEHIDRLDTVSEGLREKLKL